MYLFIFVCVLFFFFFFFFQAEDGIRDWSVTGVQTCALPILVKDTSGALIPGVSITIKHTDTGQTRTAISSDSGSYNVPLLPVGAYELTTTMPGFKQQVRTGVNLVIGQQAVIDLILEVGGPAEQIP